MKDERNSQSGNPPSTTGQGGNRMQPGANQDVGNAQPSNSAPSQRMDQGNSNANENSGAAPRSGTPPAR
jgi:hypothetical protein